MKLALVVLVVLGCGKKAEAPDRWPQVVKLATPLVPAADGALLDRALGRIEGDDVPEVALEDVIAWRKANGGLPWRDGRAIDDKRPMRTFLLGKALLARRATDPAAIEAVQYLGHRLRAESPMLLDVMIGFTFAQRIVEEKHAFQRELAPTEVELRRAIAAEAVSSVRLIQTEKLDAPMVTTVRRNFTAMVLDAPADRSAFVKHLEASIEKAQQDEVTSMLLPNALPTLVHEQYSVIDAYR